MSEAEHGARGRRGSRRPALTCPSPRSHRRALMTPTSASPPHGRAPGGADSLIERYRRARAALCRKCAGSGSNPPATCSSARSLAGRCVRRGLRVVTSTPSASPSGVECGNDSHLRVRLPSGPRRPLLQGRRLRETLAERLRLSPRLARRELRLAAQLAGEASPLLRLAAQLAGEASPLPTSCRSARGRGIASPYVLPLSSRERLRPYGLAALRERLRLSPTVLPARSGLVQRPRRRAAP